MISRYKEEERINAISSHIFKFLNALKAKMVKFPDQDLSQFLLVLYMKTAPAGLDRQSLRCDAGHGESGA